MSNHDKGLRAGKHDLKYAFKLTVHLQDLLSAGASACRCGDCLLWTMTATWWGSSREAMSSRQRSKRAGQQLTIIEGWDPHHNQPCSPGHWASGWLGLQAHAYTHSRPAQQLKQVMQTPSVVLALALRNSIRLGHEVCRSAALEACRNPEGTISGLNAGLKHCIISPLNACLLTLLHSPVSC